MWKVSISPGRFSNERLASLSIEVPVNLQTEDSFGLLVALWCGRIRETIVIEGKPQHLEYGFLAGELMVDVDSGRISNTGRHRAEAARFRIVQSETDQTKKEGSAGAKAGFDFGSLFGLGTAAASAGGQINRNASQTEQKDGEYYRVFWRVADAGHNYWRVYGVGLNPDNVLENRIVGDEPLCFIDRGESDSVGVSVSFRCDLKRFVAQMGDFKPAPHRSPI